MPTIRDSLLKDARWYGLWMDLIRAEKEQQVLVAEHIRPRPGESLLDVGCGEGRVRRLLGDIEYVGVDLNRDYLDRAARHADSTTRFVAADVASLSELGLGPFDVAMALGLHHHIDDDAVRGLIGDIASMLKPGSRYVTVDPVFSPASRTTARVLAALDRGRHVRDEVGYRRLYDDSPMRIETVRIRHDLLPFPYSHCIIEATRVR